jgi:hypothetical protein
MQELDPQKFPIGKYQVPKEITATFISDSIDAIADFPSQLKDLAATITNADLVKTYRNGGWNIRQLIHHCADSHMNAFIRFKKSLTEDTPNITGYKEAAWAEMADVALPIDVSIQLLDAMHHRWAAMLKNTPISDLERGYFHPEQNRVVPLKEAVGLYAWHGKHHLAHIKIALEK